MAFYRLPPGGNTLHLANFLSDSAALWKTATSLGAEESRQQKRPGGFASAFSEYSAYSPQHILLTDSGAAAFHLALMGLKDLHPGPNEVVIPAWCCPSIPQAILQAGLKPVLADLSPDGFGYAEGEMEKRCGPHTLAVLAVHFFGLSQGALKAPNRRVAILGDCAQDFQFRNTENTRDACFYSFGRGKALNAGHGGALCFSASSSLFRACLRRYAAMPPSSAFVPAKTAVVNLLSRPSIFWFLASLPGLGIGNTKWKQGVEYLRVAPSFSAIGSACLDAYRHRLREYGTLMGDYLDFFADFADLGKTRLSVPHISVPDFFRGASGKEDRIPARFPILVRDPALRKRLHDGLNRIYGGVTRQYPDLLHRLPGAPPFAAEGPYPGCERIAAEILTLPVTPWLFSRKREFFRTLRALLNSGSPASRSRDY